MKKILFSILVAALLSGCGAKYPWEGDHPPEFAGINRGTVDIKCPEDPSEPCPEHVQVTGGKEQSKIWITYNRNPEGKVSFDYGAEDVQAFDGQKFRAELEQKLSEVQGEVSKEVLNAVIEAAKLAGGVP